MGADTSALPVHEVYAVKYGERPARRPEHFIGGDRHDVPMPMDYFVWAAVGPERTWVIDTGFSRADGEARGRTCLRTTAEGLALVGIDAAAATDVILTHLHYDHVGGFDQFPAARFHVQDREMAFATGRHMTRSALRHGFTAEQVGALVVEVYRDRVVFHDGDETLAPGLSVHLIGGHTAGLQCVRVHTAIGWIVLASDAAHYYDHLRTNRPFTTVVDVGAMLEGHDTVRRLADDPAWAVPGHDPAVLRRYPAAGPGLEGIAVRLDRIPVADPGV
ncbi:MAG: N-acyl homoserine lactonase family protein [Acidimicrobiales bacterium]